MSTSKSPEALARLHDALREYRDLALEIKDEEEKQKARNIRFNELKFKALPDLFDQYGVDFLGVPATGNMPAFDAEIKDYYHASISANWSDERREAAFAELDRVGGGEIVETSVRVSFPRAQRQLALELCETLRLRGFPAVVEPYLPWKRLTSWLEQHTRSGQLWPDLEKIGGTIGRIVTINFRDDPVLKL